MRLRRQQSVPLERTAQKLLEEIRSGPDWSLFRDAVARSTNYSEWGSGGSTLYVEKSNAELLCSIESDSSWATAIGGLTGGAVRYIDIGPLEAWGYPRDYSGRQRYVEYAEAPFRDGLSPDCLFIDGRLRVACFLTALLNCRPGTIIVFDDYVKRPRYHVVEEFLEPMTRGVRQAVFYVPDDLALGAVKLERDRFLYVLE